MPSKSRSHSPSLPTSTHRLPRLQPTTLSIPSSRVRKSWRPLPPPTQERIRALLLAIQSQSLATLNDTSSGQRSKKAAWKLPPSSTTTPPPSEHERALTALTQKLIRSLPKMTFPAPTSRRAATAAQQSNTQQDIDLDLSSTLHRTSALAAQLSQARQSAKMLKAQIRAEEADLKRERAELRELEGNARSSAAGERERGRGLHGLATLSVGEEEEVDREVKREEEDDEEGKGIYEAASTARRRRRGDAGVGLSHKEILGDTDLGLLAKDLRSHLGMMRQNAKGLDGVRRELRRVEREVRRWEVGRGAVV